MRSFSSYACELMSFHSVCSNVHISSYICRMKPRAVVVEFKSPSVVPENDGEEDVLCDLDALVASGHMSSAIRWAISVEENLKQHREEMHSFSDTLKGSFGGRMQKNWATILFFVNKVGTVTFCIPRNNYFTFTFIMFTFYY